MVSASRAKRDVWTFLALLLLFSSVFYALVFLVADSPKQWGSYVLPFMWCPGLAALITKIVRDRSLRGLGWGWGRTRYFLIAYGLAIALCLLPYLFVWFAFDAFSRSQFIEVLSKAGLPSALHGRAGLLVVVLVISPLTGLIQLGRRGNRLEGLSRPTDACARGLHQYEPARRSDLGGVALSHQHRGLSSVPPERAALVLERLFHTCRHRNQLHAHVASNPIAEPLALGLVPCRGQRVPGRVAGRDAQDPCHLVPDHRIRCQFRRRWLGGRLPLLETATRVPSRVRSLRSRSS